MSLVELVNYAPLNAVNGRDEKNQALQVINVKVRARTRLEYVGRLGQLRQLDGENDYYLRLFYQIDPAMTEARP